MHSVENNAFSSFWSADISSATNMASHSVTSELFFYPAPQMCDVTYDKEYLFDGAFCIDHAMEENAALKLTSVIIAYFKGARPSSAADAGLVATYDHGLKTDGYTIAVDKNGIRVSYQSGAGAYYAAVTLDQLFRQRGGRLPYMLICDHPDIGMRGFHISSADKVGTVRTYKNIIDELAALKMNCLELAVFRPSSVKIKTFAPIVEYEYGLTVKDCNEIVRYGAANYVEVVPYIETFGHMDELVRYPCFHALRSTTSVGCHTLSIYDPAVHAFLESYFDDITECFHPRFITVGGDEVSGMCEGKNAELAPAGSTETDVYVYYLKTVYRMCSERDVDMYVCYDVIDRLYREGGADVLKATFAKMPRCTVIVWQYEEDSVFTDSCDRLEDIGAKYIIMPSTNTFGSVAGRLTTAEKDIKKGVGVALQRNVGVITAMFGDGGTRNPWIAEFSSLSYAAGCCWNYVGNAEDTISNLRYTNEYIYGESTGRLCAAWTLLQRHNDVFGRSWGQSWLGFIGNNGYISNAGVDVYLGLQKESGEALYRSCVAKAEEVIQRGQNVLDTLNTVSVTGKYASQVVGEMSVASKQMIVLAEYAKMLFQMRGGLKTQNKLREKAAGMYRFAYSMMLEYRATWLVSNRKGVLEDSVNWLNIPMALFGNVGKVYDINGENLFLLTPDSFGALDETLFSKGWMWNTYGKNYPTVNVPYGVYSYNDIYGMFNEGSVLLLESMEGVRGKVFASDRLILLKKGRYSVSETDTRMSRILASFYWPALLKGKGAYAITAKVRFKSGRKSVTSVVAVSGTVFDGTLKALKTESAVFFGPDENGWYSLECVFENESGGEYACFGVNPAPELGEDVFYLAELKLVKR